jgi:hypothetical protein
LSLSDNFLWRVARYGRFEDSAAAVSITVAVDGALAIDASGSQWRFFEEAAPVASSTLRPTVRPAG